MGNLCPGIPENRPEEGESQGIRPAHGGTAVGLADIVVGSKPFLPPIPDKRDPVIYRALFDFEGLNSDDLSFKKGDKLEIDESIRAGEWWYGVNEKTGKKGFVPSNFIWKDDDSPQAQDWWFHFVRQDADKMLLAQGNKEGTFLIREASDKTSYVLSVRTTHKDTGDPIVRHYRIRFLNDGGFYINPKAKFANLLRLVAYYRENSAGLCCSLTDSCPRTRPCVQLRDMEVRHECVKTFTKLGQGYFGEVWKGKLMNVIDVAVKKLKHGSMPSDDFVAEAKMMNDLRHHRLVQLLAVCITEEPFLIVTELMVNGALLDYLRKEEGKKLTFSAMTGMCFQIVEGMAYLEKMKYVHRDLRAANILVGENIDVKVADFGLSKVLDYGETKKEINTKFPIKWTAPEAASRGEFSTKSDVWSFGVLLYEIVTLGKTPYPGMSGREVLEKIEKGYRMPRPISSVSFPDSYYDLMMSCWKKEPKDRPTFEYLQSYFDDFYVSSQSQYEEKDVTLT